MYSPVYWIVLETILVSFLTLLVQLDWQIVHPLDCNWVASTKDFNKYLEGEERQNLLGLVAGENDTAQVLTSQVIRGLGVSE